jgi:putative ABC transport system permease protein
MSKFAKKLRTLWRRRQLDRDLDRELQFHLEMKAEESGDPAEARREARRRLGNPTLLKEVCRELWTFTYLESCWQDLRYALRMLAANPGITIVAVLALALSIGANTTVFSVVSSALAFDMSVDHIERMVFISATDASRRDSFSQSYLDLRDFRSEIKSIQSLAAYRFVPVNVSDSSGLPERYSCVQMSANGFSVVGAKPVLGRSFATEDERPDAPAVLMLTYHIWQDRFGNDPGILGRTIRVDEVPRTVIGVMPPNMRFPEDTDLWTPLTLSNLLGNRSNRNLLLFGRLADGVKLSAVRAEMDTIAHRLAARDPAAYKGLVADVHPFLELIGIYDARPLLIAVLCALGFVLLIACADVANLLLARAAARSREISIRIAIGAGRARIIRQLLIESLALAIAGGFFGWLVALAGLRWFDAASSKSPRPSWVDFSMNTRAFVFLAAISIGSGILFGLAPALRLSKVDVNSAVKDGGHGAAGGTRGRQLANLLVVFEMVLCVVLLAGAGLTIRSSINLYSAPVGVNPSSVLTMHINLPEAKYSRAEDQISFHQRLKTKLESLPGVESASITSHLPTAGWTEFAFDLDGARPADPNHFPATAGLVVGADYFRVMQVRPQRGRLFTSADGVSGAAVAIVDQSLAAKLWPGEDPLGKRLRLVRGKESRLWLTVAGVVPDIQQNFRRPSQRDPLIYLPYAAEPQRVMFIVARTNVPPATLVEAFRREVQSLDENLPLYDVRTLEDRIAQSRLNVSSWGIMFTIFAAVALLLASVGLYAVIAHSVSQRTREIGVRMAVGGTAPDIVRLVFAQGMRQIAIGLAIGLPLAVAATRVLRAALVGISPADPITFLAVIAVLVATGALGCAIPARRALRVDPVVALRVD